MIAIQISKADMVIFHAPTHNGVPKKASRKPLYALISMEQPKYAKMLGNLPLLEKHFDLLSTYSLKQYYPGTSIPNLPITYFPLNILSVSAVMQAPRSFARKDGFGTGERN
jgi:hypothetical protein